MLKLSGWQLKIESSRPILGDTFSYQRDRPRINTLWDQRNVVVHHEWFIHLVSNWVRGLIVADEYTMGNQFMLTLSHLDTTHD